MSKAVHAEQHFSVLTLLLRGIVGYFLIQVRPEPLDMF